MNLSLIRSMTRSAVVALEKGLCVRPDDPLGVVHQLFYTLASLRGQRLPATCPKGGTVYVPAGRYRTASLFLKSNTTLYLEKGAVLLGDNDRPHS